MSTTPGFIDFVRTDGLVIKVRDERPAIQNERHDRIVRRQPRPAQRRQGTRAAAIRHAIQEG